MKQIFSLFSAQPHSDINAADKCAARLREVTARHKAAAERDNGKRIILHPEKNPIGAEWIGSQQFSWGERTHPA
jgi:hypothetical protein